MGGVVQLFFLDRKKKEKGGVIRNTYLHVKPSVCLSYLEWNLGSQCLPQHVKWEVLKHFRPC